jgi:hypothetical protein
MPALSSTVSPARPSGSRPFWKIASLALCILPTLLGTAPAQQKLVAKTFTFKKAKPPAAFEVPPEGAARLGQNRIPAARSHNVEALLAYVAGRTRTDAKGNLEVDKEGGGDRWVPAAPGTMLVVDWFYAGRYFDLGFFFRGKDWWVCSAEILEGKQGDLTLSLWDADADGMPWTLTDYVKWGRGTWHPNSGVLLVDDGVTSGSLRVVPRRGGLTIDYKEVLPPSYLDEHQIGAWRGANMLRSQHGYCPAEAWPEGCKWLKKHTDFQHFHDPKGTGKLHPNLGEKEGLEGRTQEAHEMSLDANVSFLQPGQNSIDHARMSLVHTQSRRHVLAPGAAKFGYGRTGAWSIFRGAAGPEPHGHRYSVAPGAGSTNVPVQCGGMWPVPRSFPDIYKQPRGLPISVSLDPDLLGAGSTIRVRSIALFAGENMVDIAGFYFSIRDVLAGAPERDFFFIPGSPLTPETVYTAQVAVEVQYTTADKSSNSVDLEVLQWQFRTEKPEGR